MYFVYTLYNKEVNKIYIGQTNNIEAREIAHNNKRGNHFTAKFSGKWLVIYKEEAADRKVALVREKKLKSYQGRKFVKQFIPTESEAPKLSR